MVEDLVREFVPEAMAAGPDFAKLQRVNAKFHTDRGPARRREGDVIWRVPTREGADVYFLLEFQSDIDRSMAVRTQVYQGLLWQQVIRERKLTTSVRLPPLLLLVLYNGVYPWDAATYISGLIALSSNSTLWPWQPQVRYYLLDMRAFPREKLTGRDTLATLLFRLEQQPSAEEIKQVAVELHGVLGQHPDYAELRRLFEELVDRASTGFGVTGRIPKDLLMFRSNLDTLGEVWKQQWRAEGRAEALVCLLVEKFGVLTPSLHERISSADPATRDRWFKRAIAAPDLSSVFA
jgi:hypothetical protein